MHRSSILYRRKVIGKGRKPFTLYKIRTMVPGAEERITHAIKNGVDGNGKPVDDNRITFMGRFLRRFWIDELPQAYNLLRGDIKLIGVRPAPEEEWQTQPSDIREKALRQKPGWAGVHYAFRGGDDAAAYGEKIRRYLSACEQNPFRTDIEYGFRLAMNIAFLGVRSS